jgi:hypothetical protein
MLVNWVLQGRSVRGWPGWSRVLVVHDHLAAKAFYPTHWSALDATLRNRFPPGLGKLVLGWSELTRAKRSADPALEVAVDDADGLLCQILGFSPVLVTVTGTEWEDHGVVREDAEPRLFKGREGFSGSTDAIDRYMNDGAVGDDHVL